MKSPFCDFRITMALLGDAVMSKVKHKKDGDRLDYKLFYNRLYEEVMVVSVSTI